MDAAAGGSGRKTARGSVRGSVRGSTAGGACSGAARRSRSTKASSRVAAPLDRRIASGPSQASTRPSCISAMRSQRAASFMKWVDTKIVTPRSRDSAASSRQNRSRASGSTPEVGSSRIRISGSWITATASDSRWRTPSGNPSGRASSTSSRPKSAVTAATLACRRPSSRPNSRACRSRFWTTVSSPYSEKLCDM